MAARGERKPSYPVFRVETWEGFLKLITGPTYLNWAFRGERDERWPVYSSLSRYLRDFGVDRRAWAEQAERSMGGVRRVVWVSRSRGAGKT